MSAPVYFAVRNWRRFQHYSKRNPPWIKLHFELLASGDWVALDDASRVLAVACMLIASRNGGLVPANGDYLQRVAYLHQPPDFKPLIDCGFLSAIDERTDDASVLLAVASLSASVSASTRSKITSSEFVAAREEKEAGGTGSEPEAIAQPSAPQVVNGHSPKKLDFSASSALLNTKLMREARH